MRNIRVALAGVGSCASSLVQLISLAKMSVSAQLPGVPFQKVGQYSAGDIDFVCAFDVDERKVGRDLADSIFADPNVAFKHHDVPHMGVEVKTGPVLDGVEGNLADVIQVAKQSYKENIETISVALRDTDCDVLVCYLPTGATHAVHAYAKAAANAGVAFVNATPELVANDAEFQRLFQERGVPLLGDDIRSHLGATTLHTALIELFLSRGIDMQNTYQLNFGGNTDFLNLSSPNRSLSKQKSKRKALNAAGIDASNVSAGPNGYVEYLGDNKVCYLRMEGESILGSSVSLEVRLQVEDSPNSAGVIVNAIRAAKVAEENGLSGVIDSVCPYLFKSPRYGSTESEATRMFGEFVRNHTISETE